MGSLAVVAAVLVPVSASAAPVPGDEFWSTGDYGTVHHIDPLTGVWTEVGGAEFNPDFEGMDVDPLTGVGYSIRVTELGTTLFSTDVTTGVQTDLSDVWRSDAGGETRAYCFALDFTAGVLSTVCTEFSGDISSSFGTISIDDLRFTPLTELETGSAAIAVKDGIATIIDDNNNVWTLPVGGGVPLLVGAVTGTSAAPVIGAADFDSAGALWVIDVVGDGLGEPEFLAELDATYSAVAPVPLTGPLPRAIPSGTLAITWPSAPAEIIGTGFDATGVVVAAIGALLALALGAGLLVSRRRHQHR